MESFAQCLQGTELCVMAKRWRVLPNGWRMEIVVKGLAFEQCCLKAGGWRVLPKGWRIESAAQGMEC